MRVEKEPVRRRHIARGIASGCIAAGFLWWFLRGLDLGVVAAVIGRANAPYVIGAVAVSLGGFAFRICRWQHLVAPLRWVPRLRLASAVFIGSAVTAALPGRLGEVARAVLLTREGVPASAAFGTVVLERLLDVTAVLLLLTAALGFLPDVSPGSSQASLLIAIRAGAWIAFGGIAGITIAVLFAHHARAAMRAALRSLAGRLPGGMGPLALRVIESFGAGLTSALRESRDGVSGLTRTWITVHTVMLWVMICGAHVLLFRAFGIEPAPLRLPFLIFLITLGLSVPVPAALGSYHKAVQLSLTVIFGVSNETAAGYAIVSHAVILGPPAIIGFVMLAREGVALAALTSWPSALRAPGE